MGRYLTSIIKKLYQGLVLSIFIFLILLMPNNSRITPVIAESRSSEIVIEASSGRVLYGNNIDTRLPMASTTKIVTALVILEQMNPDSVIAIPSKAVGVEGSSIYLKANDKWKVKDLLYGLMLRSGNDAASALAIACGGSVEGFAKMMNAKATSIGLTNSNFTNPHGLHEDNHYTSAYDLAMLTREAMKYNLFREIVSTKTYAYSNSDNIRSIFVNKNKMLNCYSGANGVKTGYTKAAGRCLVSSAKRNNMQLITVTLNCNNMWGESMRIMNESFDKFRMFEVLQEGEMIGEATVTNSRRRTTMLTSHESFYYPISHDELANLVYETDFIVLKAPVKEGEIAGQIKIYLNNHLIFKTNAYTIESINDKGVRDHLRDLVDKWKSQE